jgi:hypothetical protein
VCYNTLLFCLFCSVLMSVTTNSKCIIIIIVITVENGITILVLIVIVVLLRLWHSTSATSDSLVVPRIQKHYLMPYREEMAEELLMHVSFCQEGDHEKLLLSQIQTRTAVDISVQMEPVSTTHHFVEVKTKLLKTASNFYGTTVDCFPACIWTRSRSCLTSTRTSTHKHVPLCARMPSQTVRGRRGGTDPPPHPHPHRESVRE